MASLLRYLGVIHSTKGLLVIFLVVLIVLGGYLRLHDLGGQPYWMDEGFTINAVLSVMERGDTVLDSGKHYSCLTYCYPTAIIAKTLGKDAFSYRLLSALAGAAFIAVIFFIARRLFSTNVAVFASIFTAFSYLQIAWSRQARWYTLFELFFWLALFFFYKALYEGKYRPQLIYAGLCAGATVIAIATHALGYLLPLIFAGWFSFDRIFMQRRDLRTLLLPFLSIVGAIGAATIFFLTDIGEGLLSNISLFWGIPYYGGFYLATYWLFIMLSVVALFSYRKEYARSVMFLMFAILAYLIPLAFLTDVINYRYLFHLTPALFMLAALGVESLRVRVGRPRLRSLLVVLVFVLFFTVGGGILKAEPFYFLESDDPEEIPGLSYYVYTPQPDWNNAYEYIENNREPDDIVISSMPQFNKIFLGEPGYWIKYGYLGDDLRVPTIENDREYYVGANVVDDLPELLTLTSERHGFIVFDYMATDDRIPKETLDYVKENFTEEFHEETKFYSQIWVYRF